MRALVERVAPGHRIRRLTVKAKHAFIEMDTAETATRILALAQAEPSQFLVGGGAVQLIVEAKKPPTTAPTGAAPASASSQRPGRGGGSGGGVGGGGRGAGGGRGRGPGGRGGEVSKAEQKGSHDSCVQCLTRVL
jgi:hypothetical protein